VAERVERLRLVECIGVLHYAQDDSKNYWAQRKNYDVRGNSENGERWEGVRDEW
jgi:hypothetical protein